MRLKLLPVGLIFALAAVRVAADESLISVVPKDTVITMQHGACERRCAVYKVAIFADGVVLIDGEYFVSHVGVTRYRISTELIGRFLQHATQAGFFEIANSYSSDEGPRCIRAVDDASVVVVTIAASGRAKAVVHDHRCLTPDSSRLTLIENEIDMITAASRVVR